MLTITLRPLEVAVEHLALGSCIAVGEQSPQCDTDVGLHQRPAADGEEPILLVRRADQEIDAGRTASGHSCDRVAAQGEAIFDHREHPRRDAELPLDR